ncbi:MAG: maleylpyruvate isomerase family mycothiol-dependent enzyme [Chloroflexi bacterium]|nr:maleylpyruvate isomerase family mycothiol-dependent enzyme [Chloroflexota bacterium]
MTNDPEVNRCLRLIRELLDGLRAELAALPPEGWAVETNCAPWLVRDLVAHIVVSGEGFAASIRQGLAGSVEPSISHGQREQRQAQLAAADPDAVNAAILAITDDFESIYERLTDADLGTIAFHRRGNRTVRWYAYHRLAEVAFHCWDLQASFNATAPFDEEIARLLLPTILESNAPRTYAAGLSAQKGSGERYQLVVADAPTMTWTVTIRPDRLEAVRGPAPADAPADTTITGSAANLALMLYGRRELSELFQRRDLWLDGDLLIAERFGTVFPRP